MTDMAKVINRWRMKCTPAKTNSSLTAIYEEMVRNYAAAMVELNRVEQQTRQILNSAGIPTTLYVPYLDFARELHRLKRKGISGESFTLAAAALKKKWTARELNPAVLEQIQLQVFGNTA